MSRHARHDWHMHVYFRINSDGSISVSYREVPALPGDHIMDNVIESEILSAEECLRNAMISSDIDMLDKLLAPDLMFTNHLGQVISKNDDLQAHKEGNFVINEIRLSEQKINIVDGLAIVSVLAEIFGSYKGMPANGDFRFTRVWAKENDEWKVVAGHSSSVT